MAGWGSPLLGTHGGVRRGRSAPNHTLGCCPRPRASVGLKRLLPLPPAPTNKALPLPPWRAAASRRDWGARKTQG